MTACNTCGGWVAPNERVHTDEGLYHDRIDSCLTTEVFEALVAKWSCECGQEYRDHLEDEHAEDTSYWDMKEGGPFKPSMWGPGSGEKPALGLRERAAGSPALPVAPVYSTEELAARERRFMDARLP